MNEKEITALRFKLQCIKSTWGGPTYREMAKSSGVPFSTIRKFLAGETSQPVATTLHKLKEWVEKQ